MTEQPPENNGVLKRMAVKAKHGEYVELFLRKGTLKSNNYTTYISLALYLHGKKYIINMNKEQASHLAIILTQLIQEGGSVDYEVLKQIYPDQRSWHIY